MAKQSADFERAKAMVLSDKFNYKKTEFFDELSELVARYMEYDGLTVETAVGKNNNMIISISVKKVKPTFKVE